MVAGICGEMCMNDVPLDRIHIRDLQIRCIVGVFPEERTEKQDVRLNITLHADLRTACKTDTLDDTIDYKTLKKQIVALVERSECFLIERLAESVADLCLGHEGVRRVDVTIDKPGALRFARSVAVEITRVRETDA